MLPNVKAWIYGHTHNAAVTAIGNTITACNARGYPNESVPGFGRDVFLEFKTSSREEESRDIELQLSAIEITAPQRSVEAEAGTNDLEDIEFM